MSTERDQAAPPPGLASPADGSTGSPPGIASHLISLEPYLVVFIASAATLIIEIVAARILAPHIGVSVYTWTSVIGVILAGISLGNWAGGVLADRAASRINLGLILLAGAATTLLILPLAHLAPAWVAAVPLLPRIVLLSAMLFIAPAFILGMVSPMVIKLHLSDLATTGNVVGRIYAVSTAGAILGVFLTGFVLIQALGSRETVLYVSIATGLLAIGVGRLWRARLKGPVAVLVVVGISVFTYTQDPLTAPCLAESNYFCIRVSDKVIDDGSTVKVLSLDRLVHSYAKPEDPTYLHYKYQHIFADIADFIAAEEPAYRSLFIGGGGYELPRYLDAVHPQSSIEVIEIDPEVTATAQSHLGLAASDRVVTENQDARIALPAKPDGTYDIVVGDAFNDLSVPYHLTTLEFNREVKRILKDGGVYAVNIVDAPTPGRFLGPFVVTLRETFDHVSVLPASGDLSNPNRMTTIVMASDRPFAASGITVAGPDPGFRRFDQLIAENEFEKWLAEIDSVVITDDFAPIDNYLAPLYLIEPK